MVLAQTDISLGIANYLSVVDQNPQDGDIVSYSPKGYYISNRPFDAAMVGVVSKNPAVAIKSEGVGNSQPVIFNGNGFVNVVTVNGPIREGDMITTSNIKGAAMKANRAGYVLGTALGDYTNNNKNQIGQIPVTLNIHYFFSETKIQTGLLDFFSLTTLATYEQPTVVFKYFISGIIVLLTCILGFLSFGRIANSGIEALGRNPLAGRKIQLAIIMNVFMTIVIIASGFVVAYFILNL